MDINTIRIAATVLSLFAFLGICVWAWSRRNTQRFEQAARLPFEQD
jgi:cytochrome c oxidase cbb3-type subunit 4